MRLLQNFPSDAATGGDFISPGVAAKPGERVLCTDRYIIDPNDFSVGERVVCFRESTCREIGTIVGMVAPETVAQLEEDLAAAQNETEQLRAELASFKQLRDLVTEISETSATKKPVRKTPSRKQRQTTTTEPFTVDNQHQDIDGEQATFNMNDTLQGGIKPISWTLETDPANGTVDVSQIDNGIYIYTPNGTGTDMFDIAATDAAGHRATATLTVTTQ